MSAKFLHFEKAFLFHEWAENPARGNAIPEIVADAEGAMPKAGTRSANEHFGLIQAIAKRKKAHS
ncbi:MAG: hypothetical protein V4559_16390 [Pseudomonadota bacterium]